MIESLHESGVMALPGLPRQRQPPPDAAPGRRLMAGLESLSLPHRPLPRKDAMTIHIEMLHRGESIRELLREDGWRVDKADGGYDAEHPEVQDGATARARLSVLGLLTSAALRIEFWPTAHRSGTRGPVN